jgi:hypothetical protein
MAAIASPGRILARPKQDQSAVIESGGSGWFDVQNLQS